MQEAHFAQYGKIILNETFEKLFSMIQSRCSIHSHFLKSLHSNIRKLLHQKLIVMRITEEDFKKIVKSPHFLHLTSINWLVLKVRLCFGTSLLCAQRSNLTR